MPMLFGSPIIRRRGADHTADDARGQAAFFTFVADAVARYGNGGTFWRDHPEIPTIPWRTGSSWNEVNTPGFWLPNPTPKQYADLLKPTAYTLRRVDPSAKVVLSGLFPTAYIAIRYTAAKWLKAFYKIPEDHRAPSMPSPSTRTRTGRRRR